MDNIQFKGMMELAQREVAQLNKKICNDFVIKTPF
jgi:hypothetical protein